MGTTKSQKSARPFPNDKRLRLLAVSFCCWLLLVGIALGADAGRGFFLSPGIDLMIESITLDPLYPDVGQPYTVTVIVRNQGSDHAGGYDVHLYIDPADRPPISTTTHTNQTYMPGLVSGGSFSWQLAEYQLDTLGCDHNIYAWVDRDNTVVEDDEENNLVAVEVCVGTTPTPTPSPTPTPTATPEPCEPDDYEPDDVCAAAGSIGTEGIHQIRNLCPVGDVDWAQFTARAGISYTIETSAPGAEVDTVLQLYAACGAPPIASHDPPSATISHLVWPCTASGVYSIAVQHAITDYGPLTAYDLSVTAGTGCAGDIYESDNTCGSARDITTGGVTQTHIFCAAGDMDWVKFNATSGARVVIETGNLGLSADPQLAIFDTCDSVLSAGHPQQLEWISPNDETYYVRFENSDSEVYGPDAHYEVAVTTVGCTGDDYEFGGGDDTMALARQLQPNDPAEHHNTCPAGDADWFKFEASAGFQYVIETFNLGVDADTYLCLYEADGTTQIVCDDDGTGMRAARILWTSPAAGTYYVQARHYNAGASGPTTAYDFALTIGFTKDSYEPDDSFGHASPLVTAGVTQTHNFTPDDDADWVKFTAGAGPFTLQTLNLAQGCDTTIQLYGTDGETLLAENDDFAYGLGSQVFYTFTAPGTYYGRVRNYPPSRFGSNMSYELRAGQGTPPPLPIPTPFPTPPPPVTPSPASVKTLILVNRERVQSLYDATLATQLMEKLYALACHPQVQGQILQVETDTAVAAAYQAWRDNLLSTSLANEVASAVRNLVLATLAHSPNVDYIIIAGSDGVIPFRRTLDRTSHPESTYQSQVSYESTLWAACGDDMSLTDNYYADVEPTEWSGHELYVPDYAVGRLVETPQEIMALIDLFLAGYSLTPETALVSGYDFVKDAATGMCALLGSDMGSGDVDCALIGEAWTGPELREKQLNTVPRFDIQSINGHANYRTEGSPAAPKNVSASQIATLGDADLSRVLIYTLGCHSGFNDVGDLDLAQAFLQRGAIYIANTGYGWGMGNSVGLSELLMTYFTEALMQSTSATVGEALMEAKQRYHAEVTMFNDYDEKILIESTLYGLPMYEVHTGAALGDEPFPSVVITSGLPLASGDLAESHVSLGLSGSFAAFGETETEDGLYFDLDGHTHLGANEPVQPKFFADVSAPDVGRAHGVIFTGGTYSDTAGFDPVVLQPINEYLSPTLEPDFTASGWYPPVPFALQNPRAQDNETLVASLGQFNGAQGVERVYDTLGFDVYYSDSYDWWVPIILSFNGVRAGITGRIKVEAVDASGIHKVVVVYTSGNGIQNSKELEYDPVTLKWKGNIPATASTTFYIQVVDGAGNVAVLDNKGAWYPLGELGDIALSQLYLPLVVKQ